MKSFLLGTMLLFACVNSVFASFEDVQGAVFSALKKKDYKAAYNLLEPLVEKGDVHAESLLGLEYRYGKGGFPKDNEKALFLLTKAANQKDSLASLELTSMYLNGDGVPKDTEKAFKYAKISAEQGVKDGYPNGMYNYGYFLFNGLGTKRDYKKAFNAFKKASDMGHSKAPFYVGLILEKGLAGGKKPKEAFAWYMKGAERGYYRSQNRVGQAYEAGDLVKRDFNLAVKWFTKASENGCKVAQFRLARLYVLNNSESIQKKGVSMLFKLAQENNNGAQYYLGFSYRNARGVPKSNERALFWFRKTVNNHGGYEKYASSEIEAIQKEKTACSSRSVVTLFGEPLICALRDSFSEQIKKAGAEVAREDWKYFADVYKSDKVLKGSSQLDVFYYKGQFAAARYVFPSKSESGQILKVEKLVEDKYGHYSKTESDESKGVAYYLWQLSDGVIIRVFQTGINSPVLLDYINPKIDDKLKAVQKAIEEQKKAKQQGASSAV
ncbi:hypothetical protein EI16_04975 [Hydrogenovibrio marinus]|uniref:Beta-lactamase n=1 Tax=Hydrogenovibrio marinus TaxID=28885 RepID=A0A066ZZZ3_HYDMR|nr:hypothetical protein EI16_04975 [Hydrogenovibrio marinus]